VIFLLLLVCREKAEEQLFNLVDRFCSSKSADMTLIPGPILAQPSRKMLRGEGGWTLKRGFHPGLYMQGAVSPDRLHPNYASVFPGLSDARLSCPSLQKLKDIAVRIK
jgi:hypothetical protein